MTRPFGATVWREGQWYISQCLEVDVASQGETEEEALANLKEALELHFEPPNFGFIANCIDRDHLPAFGLTRYTITCSNQSQWSSFRNACCRRNSG
jgi:hypothetical protein